MAQLEIFLCEDDISLIYEEVIRLGCYVVPDKDYLTDKFEKVESIAEMLSYFRSGTVNLFFVFSENWSSEKCKMRSISKNGRNVFYISKNTGVPNIEIYCPKPVLRENRATLASGYISYNSNIWNREKRMNEDQPPSLIACYNNLIRKLKRGGRTVSLTYRKFVLTRNTEMSGLLPLIPEKT